VLKVLGFAVLVYGGLCAYLYTRQRSLLYFPTPEAASPVGEVVSVPVTGAVLKLLVVRRPGAAAVLYFGGNAESVAASAAEFAAAAPDRTWGFVNYRGYGGSTGSPSEQALVADALALWDWLRTQYTDIAVVGRSLGSGVAVQLAAARPVSALVLVTPFDSLVSVGQRVFPWVPVSWLAKDRFEAVDIAPRLTCPTRVLIATEDEVIAPAHARRLVAAFAPGVASAVEVAGARHNDIQLWPRYYEEIGKFLAGR
jgi:pimeloyl-ACP methyl ester carboxylesterase